MVCNLSKHTVRIRMWYNYGLYIYTHIHSLFCYTKHKINKWRWQYDSQCLSDHEVDAMFESECVHWGRANTTCVYLWDDVPVSCCPLLPLPWVLNQAGFRLISRPNGIVWSWACDGRCLTVPQPKGHLNDRGDETALGLLGVSRYWFLKTITIINKYK